MTDIGDRDIPPWPPEMDDPRISILESALADATACNRDLVAAVGDYKNQTLAFRELLSIWLGLVRHDVEALHHARDLVDDAIVALLADEAGGGR